jgi:Zn-finger nucleic acid-binding protein
MNFNHYTHTCPHCNTTLQGYDKQGTKVFVCPQCQTLLTKDDRGAFSYSDKLRKAQSAPIIPLGAAGVLNNTQYRVICYAERKDDYNSVWGEYILFNEAEERYAFLSEYSGHWNLLLPLDKAEVSTWQTGADNQITYGNKTYKLYSKYTATYLHAQGEFSWPLRKERTAPCWEYIAPPHMLAKEGTGPEADYYFGTYVQPSAIKKAFGLAGVPHRIGKGVIQPFYGGIDVGYFAIGALLFIMVITILNTFITMQAKEQVVFSQTFTVNDSTAGKPFVSESFKLEGRQSNLQIDAFAQVTNSWVEAEVSLVNESTLEETGFVTGVDYYTGYDDGESWSEGSWSKEEILCAVEPGTYHFVITPAKDPSIMGVGMTLQATWDVPVWWNAILVAIVMGVITGGLYLLELNFERSRWYDSDYSPYTYSDDNE